MLLDGKFCGADGARTGQSAEIAVCLAPHGRHVVVNDVVVSPRVPRRVKRRAAPGLTAIEAAGESVPSYDSVIDCLRRRTEHPRLLFRQPFGADFDILVNNAAIVRYAPW